MKRQQTYIKSAASDLFAWIHSPDSVDSLRNYAVVICAPLGWEYIHSHRTIRHLADRLASQGIPTVRFDFHGTGDSPGVDLDSDRLETWKKDIHAAVNFARESTGCRKICLVGLRFGATLAALASRENEIESLVLWNPVVNGKRYLRELMAIAATSDVKKSSDTSFTETAGFLMSQETSEQIRKINLLEETIHAKDGVLVIQRDDFETDPALQKKLSEAQIETDLVSLPGYLEMMAEPQFTQIPEAALTAITEWLLSRSSTLGSKFTPTLKSEIQLATEKKEIREKHFHFGSENQLSGILSSPLDPDSKKPVIVLLNSGSVHRVGPNRLYVSLARKLTAQGYPVFRMDFQGLGDSAWPTSLRENHPYPDSAVHDTESALDFLKDKLGYQHSILIGLCSGAHSAFHAGVELTDHQILDSVLINPLTYQWVEGMSLATNHFQEVAYYKHTMKDKSKWVKLFKGQINFSYAAQVGMTQLKNLSGKFLKSGRNSPLSKNLRKLFEQGRPLTLIIAEQDPGYDILLDSAADVAKKAIQSEKIRIHWIKDADHTFTSLEPRNELINRVCEHLKRFS